MANATIAFLRATAAAMLAQADLLEAADTPVVTPPVVTPPASVELTAGTGPDALVLRIAQDAYQGDAQYSVRVDGKAIGKTFTARGLHSAGQSDTLTLKGTWAPGEHKVEVRFLNDAWGGSAATDRNLYIESATFNGAAIPAAKLTVWDDTAAGSFSFTKAGTVSPPVVTPPVVVVPPPVVTPVPPSGGMVNLLVRGQSNALLFCDRGGVWKLAARLKEAGFDTAVLAEWGTDTSTIHSGTPFMTWDTGGQQKSLLAYLAKQPAEVRARKTITLWLHNEDEQKGSVTKADWLKEVRADAKLVRSALGQGAKTTPYIFCPIRYNYGQNVEWLAGMKDLVADASFNATLSGAFQDASMSGDGQANSSHLGDDDMAPTAAALTPAVVAVLQALGGTVPPPVEQPPVTQPPAAGAAVWSGYDKLSHRYGHVWDHDGMLTVSSWAGEGWTQSGAMQPPHQGGNGYGVYTVDCDGSKTNGPGKFLCIWPEDDVWRWEIDIAENDYNGIAYATLHWDAHLGADKSRGYPIPGVRLDERHVWECTWARDLIVIKVDGVEKLRITENVPRDKADGGACNGLLGAGMQPAWAAQAQNGDNALNVYACSYSRLP